MPATMFRMSEQTFNDMLLAEIRAEMGRQKISQRELGRRLGWASTTTFHRLSGRTALSAAQLHEITKVLGVSASSLGFPLLTAAGQGVRS